MPRRSRYGPANAHRPSNVTLLARFICLVANTNGPLSELSAKMGSGFLEHLELRSHFDFFLLLPLTARLVAFLEVNLLRFWAKLEIFGLRKASSESHSWRTFSRRPVSSHEVINFNDVNWKAFGNYAPRFAAFANFNYFPK